MCLCPFEMISDNPWEIKRIIHAFRFLDVRARLYLHSNAKLYAQSPHLFVSQWVCVWGTPPSILLALTVRKKCKPSKSTKWFQRYEKKTFSPKSPQRWCFWLNLSKKVKCHLFCINLDTGYLLYVVLWIP